MTNLMKFVFSSVFFTLSPSFILHAIDAGKNTLDFDQAIRAVNDTGGQIEFKNNIELSNQVRAVGSDPSFTWKSTPSITIAGNKFSLIGENHRCLFVGGRNSTSTPVVNIKNLVFTGNAKGGNGGGNGGGGMGAGGGLYVGKNTKVVVEGCSFVNCSATGGNGGIGNGKDRRGGGGGLGGNGATGSGNFPIAGGGGFGGNGAGGSSQFIRAAGGGASNFSNGNATIGPSGSGSGQISLPGRNFDGGGGPGDSGVGGSSTQPFGNFGGGGASSFEVGSQGGGLGVGFYGGGGCGIRGGNGGFGAGGGGGRDFGGIGGFGGGGGGNALEEGGNGGFGANNGGREFGGGGASLGGAIFLEPGSTLTLKGEILFDNNSTGEDGLGDDIFMMSSSKLVFNTSNNVRLKAVNGDNGVGGGDRTTGGITNEGPGTLTLEGENTFTGTLDAFSNIIVQGTSAARPRGNVKFANVNVQVNASLSGDFDIGGILINAGVISPQGLDGEPGSIDVQGGPFINSGTLRYDILPQAGTSNDSTSAPLTILQPGSILELVFGPGNYIAGTQFVVIPGPTVGTFTTVILNPLGQKLGVQLQYGSVIATVLSNRLFEDQKITAGPAKEVVKCVRSAVPITPGSDFAHMIAELGTLSNKAVNQALIDISGAQFGALEWINARNNSYIASLLTKSEQFHSCDLNDCNSHVWVTGLGNFMNNHHWFDYLKPYQANAAGSLLGIDFGFKDCFKVGGSVGYLNTDLDWRSHVGHGKLNSYIGALYGSFIKEHYNIDLSMISGATENGIRRKIKFGDVTRHPKSEFWSQFFTAHLGAMGDWNIGDFHWGPFGLVDYNFFHRNGFHEHGAKSLNLHVKNKNQNMMRAEAGIKAYGMISSRNFSCLNPYFGISYIGEYPLGKSKQKSNFAGQSCTIDATSYHSTANFGSGEVGLKWKSKNGFSVELGYKGFFNTKTSINELNGQLLWSF